jgi:hypothetical protein
MSDVKKEELPITFYDSVTGKPLFTAPVGRTLNEFLEVCFDEIVVKKELSDGIGIKISRVAELP